MQNKKIKALIRARINALEQLQQEAQAACGTVTLDQSRVGRLSRMDAMQAQAMNQEAQRRRVQELGRLQAALRAADTDDYGYCEACGEEIGEARLMIDPAAPYCIQCAEKRERS